MLNDGAAHTAGPEQLETSCKAGHEHRPMLCVVQRVALGGLAGCDTCKFLSPTLVKGL